MSYNPLRNEDSLSEYFSTSSDFYLASKNLLKNRANIDNFIIWFDKCYLIDPRATIIYTYDIYKHLSRDIKMYVRPYLSPYLKRVNKCH